MIDQLKPGFTLFITSYLGDADYYNTEVITGLDRQQARLVERFVRGCRPSWEPNSFYDSEGTGYNMSTIKQQFSLGEIECLFDAVFPGVVLDSLEDDQVSDALGELAYELLGASCEYTDHLRRFESLRVAYFSDHQDLTTSLD
jgi:hypothetical protein